jgi:hypothetical protein
MAQADPQDQCVNATVEGQRLQRAGKLVDARARFLTCARAECPADIVERCEHWAQNVADALPSLVVIPRDDEGKDLTATMVRIDGVPIDATGTTGAGRAIDLDPGPHHIVVERPGSSPVELDVVLHEAEKNRSVLATFPSPHRETARPLATVTERPIPRSVWIAGGVSVAAYGVFGISAILGATDRTSSHCDTGCPTTDKDRVDTKLFVADMGLAVGTIALGVAAYLYFTRPSVQRHPMAFAF